MRRVLLVLAVFGVVFGVLFASVLVKLDYSQITNRASWQLPDRVMDALALTPGARVADIGAGDGYFTFRLADAVGAEGVYMRWTSTRESRIGSGEKSNLVAI